MEYKAYKFYFLQSSLSKIKFNIHLKQTLHPYFMYNLGNYGCYWNCRQDCCCLNVCKISYILARSMFGDRHFNLRYNKILIEKANLI